MSRLIRRNFTTHNDTTIPTTDRPLSILLDADQKVCRLVPFPIVDYVVHQRVAAVIFVYLGFRRFAE